MADGAKEFTVHLNRHDARICVRPGTDGGWDVSTEFDGREVASDYCPNWRQVERFRERMQQWLRRAERLEASASQTA